MRVRQNKGPGYVFVPTFILLAIVIFWTLSCTPADALEQSPCAPGLIHYMPYCLTEEEYLELIKPPPLPVVVQPEIQPGVEQWRSMVEYYWAKHGYSHVDRMLRIMWCESKGIPWEMNDAGSGAEGLFQIMQFWKVQWPGNYKDPWTNAAVAYQIWLEQGYQAWSCKG